MDVPVIICDKFLQFFVLVNVEVPQIQFIDRMVGFFQCAPVTCTHSANCAEDRRDPTGSVLGHG